MKKKFKSGWLVLALATVMFTQSVPMEILNVLAEEIAEVFTMEDAIERDFYNGNMVDKYNIGSGYIIQENVENRTLTTKEFLMSDDTIMVQQFAEPVHYYENGEYKEIDNSLVEDVQDGKNAYKNSANSFKVKFNKEKQDTTDFVEIEEDGYGLQLGYKAKKEKKTKIKVKNSGKREQANYKDKKHKRPKNNKVPSGKVTYKDIEDDTDIIYEVKNNKLSNSIIINKSKEQYVYTFELGSSNLQLVKNSDGSISAINASGKTKFVMPIPYMVDANGIYSNAVTYTLNELDGTTELTITADAEWINENAKFPVTITPEISSKQDKYFSVANVYENKETIVNADKVYAGKKNGAEKSDAFLSFDLPEVEPYYQLIGASVNFEYQTQGMGLFDDKDLNYNVYLAESTNDLSSITYTEKPKKTQELNGITKKSQNDVLTLSYESDIINTNNLETNTLTIGIETAAETSENSYIALAAASETTSTLYWYQEVIGIEDEYSLEPFNISGATAYVNNGSGKVTAVFDLASVNTLSDMPLDVELVYNDHYDNILNEINKTSYLGKNFKLNFQQYIIQHDNVYELIDADGSISTFYYCAQNMIYYSKEKKLYYNSSTNIIYDLVGNEMHFENGRLKKIISQNNPTEYIEVMYATTTSDKITQVRYYANSVLKYTVSFSYVNDYLAGVTTNADANTPYKCALVYDNYYRMTNIINETGISGNNTNDGVQMISLGYYGDAAITAESGVLQYIYNNQKQGIRFYRNWDTNKRVYKVENLKYATEELGDWRCCAYTTFSNYGSRTAIYYYENNTFVNSRYVAFNNTGEVISEWQEDSNGIVTVTMTNNWKNFSAIGTSGYEKYSCTYTHKLLPVQDDYIGANGGKLTYKINARSLGVSEHDNYTYAVIFKVETGDAQADLNAGINLKVKIASKQEQTIQCTKGGSMYIMLLAGYYPSDKDVVITNQGTDDITIQYFTYAVVNSEYESYIYDSNTKTHMIWAKARRSRSGYYKYMQYDEKQRIDLEAITSVSTEIPAKETLYTYNDSETASTIEKGKIKEITTIESSFNENGELEHTETEKIEYNYTGSWNNYTETVTATQGNLKTRTVYNVNRSNKTITQTDANNITTTAKYTTTQGDIRLREVTDGNTTERYAYNTLGQITNIDVCEGSNTTPVFSQTDHYDLNGVYMGSSYGGTKYTYGYDETGFVTSIGYGGTGANDTSTPLLQYTYNYNGQAIFSNRLAQKTYANGNVENYTYNKTNTAITTRVDYKATNGGFVLGSYTYNYNIQGAMTSQQHQTSNNRYITYNYGKLDDLEERTFSITGLEFSFQYTTEYDTVYNRIKGTEIYSVIGCSTTDFKYGVYSYNTDGAISSIIYDTFSAEYAYDDMERLNNRTTSTYRLDVQNENYIYKTYGNGYTTNLLTCIDDQTDENNDRTTTYDANGYITGISYNGNTYAYEYDGAGRLVTEKKNGQVQATYEYDKDGANNVQKTGLTYTNGVLTSVNGARIVYDKMGNPTTYKGNTFRWQQGRKLAGGSMYGNSFSYAYDGNGMRYEKKVNGTTTQYYWNGDQLLMESKNGKRTWYVYDVVGIAGMIVEDGSDQNMYYFDKNTLGDIVAIRNDDGDVVATYEYDAWGNVTVMDEYGYANTSSSFIGNVNPFRYRGYYYDTETGFYYLQTRYYDPTICRFINADNYELVATLSSVPGQLNMYAYCNNNPIMYTDETGESITALLIGLGVAFLIGAGTSLVSQGIDKGWDSINCLQVCTDGLFAAAAVGLAYTGIGLGASVALGAGLGMTQYTFSAYAYGAEFSMDGLLFSGAMGALGGFISGAGAQNVKGLAGAILKDSGPTAVAMISGMRNLTGNMAFSNVVTQQFTQATYKINATTVLMPAITSAKNALKRFFVVD